ncbi:MAG: hypothetical protein ACTSWD_04720 [Candidatus Heimdallarchaeota archaeon]
MAAIYLTDTATGNPLNQTTLDFLTAVSSSVDYNNGIITQATLTATFTGDTPTFYMSADGGDNWEEVTSGVAHTFVNTGTDLRWKAEGAGTTITKVKIASYH